jgi:PAS domain S-box-containing protein
MKNVNMLEDNQNHLWKLLWEYDPNGLIIVDADMYIKLVNPAFCKMFQLQSDEVVGLPASLILGEIQDFKQVWQTGAIIRGKTKQYSERNLYVSQVIFSIEDEGIVVCIMVDITHQLERRKELDEIKLKTVKKVNEVVDNQMKVVQEIAGLLGETTAETKVSLLQILQMLETENF